MLLLVSFSLPVIGTSHSIRHSTNFPKSSSVKAALWAGGRLAHRAYTGRCHVACAALCSRAMCGLRHGMVGLPCCRLGAKA